MGQCHFPRARDPSSPCQSLRRQAMVRCSKRSTSDQWPSFRQKPCHTVKPGNFHTLLLSHLRKNCGKSPRHHSFARSRRSQKQQIMKTCSRQKSCPFETFLPFQFTEVTVFQVAVSYVFLLFCFQIYKFSFVFPRIFFLVFSTAQSQKFLQTSDSPNLHSFYQPGLRYIRPWNYAAAYPFFPSQMYHRQNSRHRSHTSI